MGKFYIPFPKFACAFGYRDWIEINPGL
jgi:hypothetical protein